MSEEPEPEESVGDKPKVVEEPVGLDSQEPAEASDLEIALSDKDPWMQRKEDGSA